MVIDSQMASQVTNDRVVVPMLGGDIEFGNFIQGMVDARGTGRLASRLLLSQFEGVPSTSSAVIVTTPSSRHAEDDAALVKKAQPVNVQDWGRKYATTDGSCAYIDLDHLEKTLPEVRSAADFVKYWHASIRAVREACRRVNERLREPFRLQVLANNSDGLGNSYGSHVSVLLSRGTFNDIFHYQMHKLLYLASFQTSSIVFAGQGKVGSENGRPDVDFQLLQRADYFETLAGLQTTYCRPVVNSRDEALCGTPARDDERWAARLARLHVIFYDSTLCHTACFLKAGVLQLITTLISANRVNFDLILDDPVGSVVAWSHDHSLRRKRRTVNGKMVTAIELQMLFLEEAQKFADVGGFDGVVPDADEILTTWARVLEQLAAYDLDGLFGQLDWVTKLQILEHAMHRRPGLTWDAPELKHLDHAYSNLDPDEGLYWAYERSGAVARVASEQQIEQALRQPPKNTRAWTRAMLLKRAEREGVSVDHIDWDRIRFRLTDAEGWPLYRTVDLPNPLGMTEADTHVVFETAETFEALLDLLGSGTADTAAYANAAYANAAYANAAYANAAPRDNDPGATEAGSRLPPAAEASSDEQRIEETFDDCAEFLKKG